METDTIPIIGITLHFRTPAKTLACLHAQKSEGIRKTLVIDNSEDGGQSIASIREKINEICNAGFHVEILHPRRNLGFASGVNAGLAHCQNEKPSHVLLINSDAQLAKGSIHHMLHALKNAPLVAPHISQKNNAPTTPFAYYDRLLGLITLTPKLTPTIYASGCCLLIRHDHTHTLRFDQDFFFYGEDVMFGFNCQQQGVVEQECPEAIVLHATSSSSQNGSIFYEYHINRSHWLLAKKMSRNPFEYFIFLAARCLTLPLRALIRSLRFRSLVAWKGFFMATTDVLNGRLRTFTPPPTTVFMS